MSVKERKERERKEMQELIINAAIDIFKAEGIDSVSIRKIAARIEYSPAIIYHYFKDKDEIISQMMKKGYGKIMEGLASVPEASADPEKRIKASMRKVIGIALEMPDEYKAVQLNSAPGVLTYTASLYKGAAKEKPALGELFKCVKEIYKDMDDDMAELTSQIIWTSTFGLIIKLIIERKISEEQRNKLIEHHIRCIVDGMMFGRGL